MIMHNCEYLKEQRINYGNKNIQGPWPYRETKTKLLNLLSRYKEDVFTGLECARQYPYELKLKKMLICLT